MEAVVFDGTALSLKYEKDYPMPIITKDDEVIVKVEYSGICGTDIHVIQGEFPASKMSLPLGHEFSGVIHEAGEGSVFKKGQKVVVDPNRSCQLCDYCRVGSYQHCKSNGVKSAVGIWVDGGWAEYVCVPQDQVFLLPDDISTEIGALCEPLSCVSHGFDRASPMSIKDKILIMGSGIIGNLWLATFHHHGFRNITVSGRNKKKMEYFKKMDTGSRLITPDELANENQLYDVIVDCTGSATAMETSLNLMNPGGKYVVFGCCPATHKATFNPFQVYVKELTIIGAKVNPFSFPAAIGWLKSMGDRYLAYEKLGVKTYPLSEYEKALQDLKTGAIAKAMFKIE